MGRTSTYPDDPEAAAKEWADQDRDELHETGLDDEDSYPHELERDQ